MFPGVIFVTITFLTVIFVKFLIAIFITFLIVV